MTDSIEGVAYGCHSAPQHRHDKKTRRKLKEFKK